MAEHTGGGLRTRAAMRPRAPSWARMCGRGTAVLPVILALIASAAAGDAARSRSVLVIDAEDPRRPGMQSFLSGFRAVLAERAAPPVALYGEALELARFGTPDHLAALRQYLRAKYRGRAMGALIAAGDPTLGPAIEWREDLWPGVPIVFVATSDAAVGQAERAGAATGVVIRVDVAGTLRAALALLPDTRRVAVVSGRPAEASYGGLVERALGEFPQLEVIALDGLPMAVLRQRLAALPEHTIVLYTSIFVDGAGQAFVPRDALALFAPDSNRPIFGYAKSYLGHGIVGGSLFDQDLLGREVAERTLRVLDGEPAAAIPVSPSAANRLLFDGRQLDRWGLSESRLPRGSQVLLRPPTLWQRQRGVILGVAGALVLQSTVIVVLLLERRRRRAAERGQRLLAARLITAQEDERTRIARDLHDDACQRLALMAIELDELAQPAADSGAFLGARVHALADSARGLSADVRRIAYELHPASLDQFGLVPAVRRFAEELGARNGIAIEIVDSDWPKGPLPRDVSLVLYRVTQEALRNVAEHSGAPEARVVFRGRSGGVAVVVSDKGRGFDVEAPANERRLGLAGMRERLGLLGGRLRIESAPGAGATVEAWVPNPPALPMTADAAPSLDVLR